MHRGKWIGRLLLTTTENAYGAPFIDGCATRTVESDGAERRAGGYAIRFARTPSGQPRCVVIAWRDARLPRARSPYQLYRHLLWVARGRPRSAPMTTGGECADRL